MTRMGKRARASMLMCAASCTALAGVAATPGGFLFKALPARYGVELSRTF